MVEHPGSGHRRTVDSAWWGTIGLIILASGILHLFTIDRQSLFIDEVAELAFSKESIHDIIWKSDSMPPLFPLLMKGWIAVFGSDQSARWFSALCGAATSCLIFTAARASFHLRPAVLTTILFSLSPLQVYYEQLIRSYALVTLLASCALALFLKALDSNRRRDWIYFGMAVILGNYTHYYFPTLVVALVAGTLISRRPMPWIGLAIAGSMVTISCLPLLYLLPGDFGYQHDIRAPRPVTFLTLGYTYFSLFAGYSLGPSQSELQSMGGLQALRANAVWILALAASLLPAAVAILTDGRSRRILRILIVVAFLPVAMVGAACLLLQINYNVRHVYWVLVPVCMLLGASMDRLIQWKTTRWTMAPWVLSMLIGLMIYSNFNRIVIDRYQNEDVRSVAVFLYANRRAEQKVFVVSDYMEDALDYYMADHTVTICLPDPNNHSVVFQEQQQVEDAIKLIEQAGPVHWLVYSRAFHGDPEQQFLKELSQRMSIQRIRSFPGVDLYRLSSQSP